MADIMERVVALTKRRGFIYPSSEIYGGLQATYDYGPMGVELKRLIKDDWWRDIVRERDNVVGLDASILMAAKVWEVSGHVGGFNDPMIDCKTCKGRFRADKLDQSQCLKKKKLTPNECGGDFTEPRQFNLMFSTKAGPVDEDAATIYLRPETAQGILVNFKNVMDTTRVKIPFGVGQIGKSFRNEIVTGGQIFRMREFEQMEMEFFCAPGSDEEWHEYWMAERMRWWQELGLRSENLRLRAHEGDELAHYARACSDIEYKYPWGWDEVEGVANRTDYDLKKHQEGSGKGLAYRDEEKKEWIVPYVVEPAMGVDRCFLTILCDAYEEEAKPNGETRTVLHLHPRFAPVQVGIFPLVKKDGMPEKAEALYAELRKRFRCTYDKAGSIGKRYARLDEVGTPFCVTIDGDTATDGTVTVRHRDSLVQERIAMDKVGSYLADQMAAWTRG